MESKPSLLNKGPQDRFVGAYRAMRDPLMAAALDEKGRQIILGGCSLYYAVVGTVVNICHSLMVDATALIKERKKVYRFEVKKEIKAAFCCLNDLMTRIRTALKGDPRGEVQYQIWMDFTDKTEEILRPDIQKLFYSMDNYLHRLKIEDSKYIVSIIITEIMLQYCGKTFRTVFGSFYEATGMDIRCMFDTSDLSDVLYHWSKVADLTTSGGGNNVDFHDDADCCLAIKVIENKMANERMYDLASDYCIDNNEVLQEEMDLVEEIKQRVG